MEVKSIKKTVFLLLLLLSLQQTSIANAAEIVFYVSLQGNDSWSGKTDAPNAAKKDGPFATLARAKEAIRALKRSGALNQPVKVYLRQGTYFLPQTLVFTDEDSGTEKTPVTYAAYPNEKPVISGGFLIDKWRKEGKLWVAEVKGVKEGKVPYFQQLFVNDLRAIRARTPNEGYFRIMDPPNEKVKGSKGEEVHKSFKFAKGDLTDSWTNVQDAKIVMYNVWLDFHMPIEKIDEAGQTVHLQNGTQFMLKDNHHPEGARYFIENVFEALDTPGEWYLHREKEVLYYYPRDNENSKQAVAIAPRLETLIKLQGNPAEDKYIKYVNWEGITFSHNEWNIPVKLNNLKQAADLIESHAVEAVGLQNSSFSKCNFIRLGTYGLEIAEGSSRNIISRCVFKDNGAGGIKLTGSTLQGPLYDRNSHNRIEDCEVSGCGKIHPSMVGIFLKHTADNVVSHNYIHHLPYSGISVGFDWEHKVTVSQNNIIEWNYLHDIGMEILSDMGAIYTQGIMPGTIIRNNHIHEVKSWRALAHGIYLDGSTGKVKVENNLVYNCGTTVIFQSRAGRAEAKDNIIENNIFAFGGDELINMANDEGGKRAFIASRNIFLANGTPCIGSHYNSKVAKPVFECEQNLYWNMGPPQPFAKDHPKFGKGALPLEWKDWQAIGQDEHSIYADPLFVNPLKGDFTLKENSPAKRIGFEPFSIADAGIRPEK